MLSVIILLWHAVTIPWDMLNAYSEETLVAAMHKVFKLDIFVAILWAVAGYFADNAINDWAAKTEVTKLSTESL